MDNQLKHRLTGAIILVALVVLLVPEILTRPGRPAPANESSAVDEQPLRSYTIDLADEAGGNRIIRRDLETPAPRVETQAQPTPEPVQPQLPEEEAVAATEAPLSEVTETTTAPVAPPAASVQPARPASAASADERAAKPVAAPVRAASPSTAAASSSEAAAGRSASGSVNAGTSQPAAAASRDVTGWAIQVGSFTSRENAQRLVGQLKGRGFAAFVVEGATSGRKFYRVRVGPERDRVAAQALSERLRAAGQTGSIVAHP